MKMNSVLLLHHVNKIILMNTIQHKYLTWANDILNLTKICKSQQKSAFQKFKIYTLLIKSVLIINQTLINQRRINISKVLYKAFILMKSMHDLF